MRIHSHASRLVTAGVSCSALCAVAGVLALTGPSMLKLSSTLLVLAAIVALVGYAYADNRGLGWGVLALVAATLPLFGALYAIGSEIMRLLGAGVAGGCLIALSVAVAAASIGLQGRIERLAGPAPRGAPRAPSER